MTSLPTEQLVEKIRAAMLRWNPKWLEKHGTPDICRVPARKLKITYENYKDYETTFVPLLMHETWAQIYEEYNRRDNESLPMELDTENFDTKQYPLREAKHKCISKRETVVGIQEYKAENENIVSVRCQLVCDTDKVSHFLSLVNDGDLIKLDLVLPDDVFAPPECYELDKSTGQKIMRVFGYVRSLSTERVDRHTQLAECFTNRGRNNSVINYDVIIALRRFRINETALVKIEYIYYIRPIIRQFESIFYLQESPLISDILCPKQVTCQLSLPSQVRLNSTEFNETQFKVIVGATEALNRSHPKIQLIQGPPGTGKTHTLIGLVKYFYKHQHSTSAPKILICAPSNGAIDEVAKRLVAARKFMLETEYKRNLRLVRIGNTEQVNPTVKSISLDELVETNSQQKVDTVKKKVDQRIQEIEKELSGYDTEISNLRFSGQQHKIPDVEAKMAKLFKEIETRRSGIELNTKRETSDAAKKQLRIELVRNADVILTTLNSCQKHPLDILFRGGRAECHFHCAIVDEASQCCEPELLMPLRYGMSRLILIGDPMQLPATVISRYAQSFDFGQSLFERFFTYFGLYKATSPIAMLTMQYRMHPDICKFPSKQFYDNRLISVKSSQTTFPLKPYILMDLKYSRETKDDGRSFNNTAEASLVKSLVDVCVKSIPAGSTIGIITPYRGQQRLIDSKLSSYKSNKKIIIDVNTCDGFQGQERDVIILSCVRSFEADGSIGFLKSIQRINVALTRAKNCLIVCISARSLQSNKNWSDMIEDAKERQSFHILSQPPSSDTVMNILEKQEDPQLTHRSQNNVPAKKLIPNSRLGVLCKNEVDSTPGSPMELD